MSLCDFQHHEIKPLNTFKPSFDVPLGTPRLALCALGLFAVSVSFNAHSDSRTLSLEQVIDTVTASDLTLQRQLVEVDSAQQSALAAAALPAPVLGFKLGNVPLDTLSFQQEAMTQAVLSYSQKLPPKQLLKSRNSSLLRTADVAFAKRLLRVEQLRQTITTAWVNGWQAEQIIAITARHRSHFEQMVRSAEANYRAGLRRSSQRDVLALNTTLARLDHRSQAAQTRSVQARASLREWLNDGQLQRLDFNAAPELVNAAWAERTDFSQHPATLLQQRRVEQATASVKTAAAMGESGRAVSLSYGYRADSDSGASRSDFISLGFSMELSGLRGGANRAQVNAAQAKRQGAAQDRQLVELRLLSDYRGTKAVNAQLAHQLNIYEQRLLPQSEQLNDSVRGAYGSGEASFAAMQVAQVDSMNIELELIDLQGRIMKNAVKLQYLSATETGFLESKP